MTLQLIQDGEDGLSVRNKLNSLVLTYNASGIEVYDEGHSYFKGDYAIFLNKIVQCMYGSYPDGPGPAVTTSGQFAMSRWREVKTDAMLKGTTVATSVPNFGANQSARLNQTVTLNLGTSEIAFTIIPSSIPGADYGVVWCGQQGGADTELRYYKSHSLKIVTVVSGVETVLAEWDLSGVTGVTGNADKQIRFQLRGSVSGQTVNMLLRYRTTANFQDFVAVSTVAVAGVTPTTQIPSGVIGNNVAGTKPIGKLQHIFAKDSTQQHYWPLEEGGTNASFINQHAFWDVIGNSHGTIVGSGLWETLNTPTSYNFAYGYTEVDPTVLGGINGKPKFQTANVPLDGFTRIECAYRLSNPLNDFNNITFMQTSDDVVKFKYENKRLSLVTTGGTVAMVADLSEATLAADNPEVKFIAGEPVTHRMNTVLSTDFQDLDNFGGSLSSLAYMRARVTGGSAAQVKDQYTLGYHSLGNDQWILYYTDTDGVNTNAVGVVVQFGYVGNAPTNWIRAKGLEVRWAPGTDHSKLWTAGQYNTMALASSSTGNGHTLYELEVTNGTRPVNFYVNNVEVHGQNVNAASPYLAYNKLGYIGVTDANSKAPSIPWSMIGNVKSFVRGSTTNTIFDIAFSSLDWDGVSQTALRSNNRDYTVSAESGVSYTLSREPVANYRIPFTSLGAPIRDGVAAGLTLVDRPSNWTAGGNIPNDVKGVGYGPFRWDTGDSKLKHYTLVNGVQTWQEV